MWLEYYGMMEPNAVKMMKTLYEDGKNGGEVMDLYPLLKQARFSLGILNCTRVPRL